MTGMFRNVTVPSTGGGDYLRLKDGDNFKVRFFGEVYVFLDKYGNTRWGNVVWNYTEDKAQAYSYTKTIVNRVKELEEDEDWGDVREYDVKVSRKGSTKEDTEYSLTPNPSKNPLTKEQKEACEKLDLSKMFKGSVTIDAFNDGVELTKPDELSESDIPDFGEPISLDDLPEGI